MVSCWLLANQLRTSSVFSKQSLEDLPHPWQCMGPGNGYHLFLGQNNEMRRKSVHIHYRSNLLGFFSLRAFEFMGAKVKEVDKRPLVYNWVPKAEKSCPKSYNAQGIQASCVPWFVLFLSHLDLSHRKTLVCPAEARAIELRRKCKYSCVWKLPTHGNWVKPKNLGLNTPVG